MKAAFLFFSLIAYVHCSASESIVKVDKSKFFYDTNDALFAAQNKKEKSSSIDTQDLFGYYYMLGKIQGIMECVVIFEASRVKEWDEMGELNSPSHRGGKHFPAEFWHREDGKYCVKVISDPDNESINHVFVFDHISLDGG